MEEQLVLATWGLVVVTALLVIATLIPFVGDILRRRAERSVVATRMVPDLNILRSRLDGGRARLSQPAAMERHQVAKQMASCRTDLKVLAPVLEVRETSLQLTNELYVLRHLLTFAHESLEQAERLFDVEGQGGLRERDKKLAEAQRAYMAASLTLDAAEELLPRGYRTIHGERFWDRFARVSDERENQAAEMLLQEGRVNRTSRGSSLT